MGHWHKPFHTYMYVPVNNTQTCLVLIDNLENQRKTGKGEDFWGEKSLSNLKTEQTLCENDQTFSQRLTFPIRTCGKGI